MKSTRCGQTSLLVMAGFFLLIGAGCKSSGVADRRTQHIEAYRTFEPETRKLVDKGRIQIGMDTNAVFIAWGRPSDAFAVDIPGGQRLIWNYEAKWAYEVKRRVPEGNVYGRARYTVERWHIPITYVAKSVTFSAGKVIQWKAYDPPPSDQPMPGPANSRQPFY
jgi:hypothetical protein